MNHAEQPPLAGIIDDGARKKFTSRGDRNVTRLPYQLVNVVWDTLVMQELLNRIREAKFEVIVDFILTGAEAGAAQQVLDDMLAVPNPFAFDGISPLLHGRAPGRHHTPPAMGGMNFF